MKKMSGGKIALIVIVLALVVGIFSSVSAYNSLVTTRENVLGKKAGIETMLQRRADLIPNLVETVKGYAAHETEIMTEIANARSRLAGATTVEEMQNADQALTGALSRLLVVVENYPDLKADRQFTALMDELSGSENRIAVARKDYNDAAQGYNSKIKTFPAAAIAGMFGFESMPYFEAAAGAETPPVVSFK